MKVIDIGHRNLSVDVALSVLESEIKELMLQRRITQFMTLWDATCGGLAPKTPSFVVIERLPEMSIIILKYFKAKEK